MKIEHFTELYKSEAPDDIGAYKINFGKYKTKSYRYMK